MIRHAAIFITLALASLLCHSGPRQAVARADSGSLPGNLTVVDVEGRTVDLEDVLPASNTLLVFWRVDSKPSREAVIHIHQNLPRLSERGVSVLALTPSDRSEVTDFLETQGIAFHNLHDPGGKVATAFELGYVYPSLVLVAEDREILGRTAGGGESFDAGLSRLLRECESRPGGRGWIWILSFAVAGAALLALGLSR